MALEHTPRVASPDALLRIQDTLPSAKNARATDPRGELRGKVPPPAWGGAPLRGVGLAVWPSRWVTGGPDLPRRLGNRRTWRRAAPNCEFSVRHPLRKTPLGQNQAGSHALNCPPPAWRGAPSRGVEQMSELSHSRFRQCFCSKLRLMAPASVPLSSLETWRGAQVRRGEGESQKRCQNRPKNTRFYGRFCPTFRPFYA